MAAVAYVLLNGRRPGAVPGMGRGGAPWATFRASGLESRDQAHWLVPQGQHCDPQTGTGSRARLRSLPRGTTGAASRRCSRRAAWIVAPGAPPSREPPVQRSTSMDRCPGGTTRPCRRRSGPTGMDHWDDRGDRLGRRCSRGRARIGGRLNRAPRVVWGRLGAEVSLSAGSPARGLTGGQPALAPAGCVFRPAMFPGRHGVPSIGRM
jgi:hypothetical protein